KSDDSFSGKGRTLNGSVNATPRTEGMSRPPPRQLGSGHNATNPQGGHRLGGSKADTEQPGGQLLGGSKAGTEQPGGQRQEGDTTDSDVAKKRAANAAIERFEKSQRDKVPSPGFTRRFKSSG
ncbi:hypothetical protein GGF43_005533, partial [Coemansia sp. RSA 2618]